MADQPGEPFRLRVFILSKALAVRTGLAHWLAAHAPVHCAGDSSEDYVGFARQAPVDLLLVDALLARDFLATLAPLRHPRRAVLLAPGHAPGGRGLCAPDCACAWLPYDADSAHLERVLSPAANCRRERLARDAQCEHCVLPHSLKPPALPLSRREQAVFEHIGAGLGPSAIARVLGVSAKTVESLRERVKQKLGLSTAWELAGAALAWRLGWFERGRALPARIARSAARVVSRRRKP